MHMYTANPQLIHILLTAFALLASTVVLTYVVYLSRWFRKENPTKSLVNELRKEVSQYSGELADLEDRFSRFQKREGMRHARSQKTSDGDLRAEAEQIIAQGAQGAPVGSPNGSGVTTGRSPKADLYAAAGLTGRH